MYALRLLDVEWKLGLSGFCVAFLGIIFGAISGVLYTNWLHAEYEHRDFVPYRTALTEVIPGYQFTPGLPNVSVSFEEFRAQSEGKPFVLSYSPEWPENTSATTSSKKWYIDYLLKRSTSAGDVYISSRVQIPDYDTLKFGSFGYGEHTAFSQPNLTFVSVNTGTSYWVLLGIMPLMIVGFVCLFLGPFMMFESLPYSAQTQVQNFFKRRK